MRREKNEGIAVSRQVLEEGLNPTEHVDLDAVGVNNLRTVQREVEAVQ